MTRGEEDQGERSSRAPRAAKESHRATVRGLGLKWTNHTVEVIDTPATRGMINKVSYLVKVVG